MLTAYRDGVPLEDLAERFGVSASHIRETCSRPGRCPAASGRPSPGRRSPGVKQYPVTSRVEYEAIQRARTEAKWTLNGITRAEVAWIKAHVSARRPRGPILCLGVRNGLEVELFREAFGRVEVPGRRNVMACPQPASGRLGRLV